MYFDLTDDQKAIAETVQSVLRDHLPEASAVATFDAGVLDRDLWGRMGELGLGGVMVPEAAGGLGLDLLTLVAIAEKLGWAAAPVPVTGNAVAAWIVATAGTDSQRHRWLGRLIRGEAIAAFALQDADDIEAADASATGALLDGRQRLVAWGNEADLLIVRLTGGLALVDSRSTGVFRRPIEATDRSRPLADLEFDRVEAEYLGGGEGVVDAVLDALYILAGADACGAGNRALALAIAYAKTRTQFGRLVGSFQGLKHQLANLTAEMEPCRYLVWYAAHAWDRMPEQRSYLASMAKAHVTDIAVRTARGAVEAHGGIGYTWEYPLHIYLKRAMFDRADLGLPQFHRARSADLAGWTK